MTYLRTISIAFALSLAVVAPAAAQDFQRGLDAAQRGDFATALREWRPLAEQGNADAQSFLGAMYHEGEGLPQDFTEAVRWYRLAAVQGDAFAQHNLGFMYAKGQGVAQDEREAAGWYYLAAVQGLAAAQYKMGSISETGQGVPQDYKEAVRWYRLAAEKGNVDAQYQLGDMHQNGRGVPKNFTEAVFYYRLAAEQDYAPGQYKLGTMYEDGGGVPQDYKEAVRWYRLAAEQGLADAQHNLGLMYANGRGVPEDLVSAFMWFNLAAAQNNMWSRGKKALYAKQMTREQIAEAQSRSARCEASGYTDCGVWPTVTATPPPKPDSDADKPVLIGAGSSFTISRKGHLLTNQHVVDGCQLVTIHLPSGLKKARVVATDDTNDLALLKTDLEDDNFIPISGSNVSLLEDVIVAGYPLSNSLSTTVKVTKGVVSSLAGLGNDYSQIQIDAAIQPGNSGGPILNDQGNVVAVTVAALNKEYFLKEQGTIPENTNFGIKSSTARAFVDANGVKLPQPYSRAMSRRDMADLITETTHLVGCWVSRATAQKMASDQKQELSVSPTMQRQVDALR
jgi:uncharacterized protein